MKLAGIINKFIPYASQKELNERVVSLFQWNAIGDPFPKRYSKYLKFPNGVLISYPRDSAGFTYFSGNELRDLIKNLPEDNEIIREIISQADQNLYEILNKSDVELKKRNPPYLNSFHPVAGFGSYEKLFELVKEASYHVCNMNLTREDNQKKEAQIIKEAATGMIEGYSKSHSSELEGFLDFLWSKKKAVPFAIRGYYDLKSEKAIQSYFELAEISRGETHFLLNGIERGLDFLFIGRKLQKIFPDYNFNRDISFVKDDSLKRKLEIIFI